jgi:antitoxin MazE
MKLARWGNSLAVRIPAEVVATLNFKDGEEIQIVVSGENEFKVYRDRKRLDAIERMRKMRFTLPDDYVFNREELHER